MANLSSKTGTVTTPVQTQISLANNAATSVQDMSAYDSQEVTGFVYVDATADLRCSFKVMVVKNGAGTYEVASTDLSGDNFSSAPMVSFSMSGSILQATLPNVTGFASAYLRYQLSAPYLGGNYPLTVSARQVAGDVSGVTVPAGYIGERITWTSAPATQTATLSEADWTNATITLTPGVWQVYASIATVVQAGTAAGSTCEIIVKITDSSNNIIQEMDKSVYISSGTVNTNPTMIAVIPFSFVANVNSSTTYKIRTIRLDGVSTGGGGVCNQSTRRSQFFAVRIA